MYFFLTLKYSGLLLIVLILFCRCNTDPKSVNCGAVIERVQKADKGTAKKPVYIVLCDFSSSMDSGSIKYVQEQAVKILDTFYNKAIIKFYSVTNASTKPLFESGMITITDTSAVSEPDFFNFQKCQKSIQQDLKSSLNKILKVELKNRPRATYIIQSLEKALDVISVTDPKQVNRNIIFILSDMLESGSSSFGSINIEDGLYTDDIQRVEASTSNILVPSLDKNIDIRVGLYSSNVKNPYQLSIFWNLIFNKLGYMKKVIISNELNWQP